MSIIKSTNIYQTMDEKGTTISVNLPFDDDQRKMKVDLFVIHNDRELFLADDLKNLIEKAFAIKL